MTPVVQRHGEQAQLALFGQSIEVWSAGGLKRSFAGEFLAGVIRHSLGVENHIFHRRYTRILSLTPSATAPRPPSSLGQSWV